MIAKKDAGVLPMPSERLPARGASHSQTPRDDALASALERTSEWLLACQHDEGYWVGELEGDTILESEYILLLAFLGKEADPVLRQCARYIQDLQLPGGGWSVYPGGPTDVSASVKAYFALKLVGVSPDLPAMVEARRAILELAVRTSATASRGFTWRSWARSATTNARACRRSWC